VVSFIAVSITTQDQRFDAEEYVFSSSQACHWLGCVDSQTKISILKIGGVERIISWAVEARTAATIS
jgi:hypothetical protein